jgi:hypothetical protein
MRLDLALKDVQDPIALENFKRIKDLFDKLRILDGEWQFFESDIQAAGTHLIKHHLSFMPKDILLLHITGDHRVYFKYQEFDSDNLVIVASGPCLLRFFAGNVRDGAYGGATKNYAFVAP